MRTWGQLHPPPPPPPLGGAQPPHVRSTCGKPCLMVMTSKNWAYLLEGTEVAEFILKSFAVALKIEIFIIGFYYFLLFEF